MHGRFGGLRSGLEISLAAACHAERSSVGIMDLGGAGRGRRRRLRSFPFANDFLSDEALLQQNA